MKRQDIRLQENSQQASSNITMLTFDEACKYLKVSKSFLYKATSERSITFYKPTGKLIYFDRKDLDAWLLQNRFASKTEISNSVTN